MTHSLDEIWDKIELEQKSRALQLSQIAILNHKIDTVMDILSKKVSTQSDASARRRERTWSQ